MDNGIESLKAENLVKRYRKREVVGGVSLEVKPGEVVGLLGPNGAGKTTTFYMITGFVPPNSGKVSIGKREITNLPTYKRARLGIGYLAQEASVFRKLSVEDNILAILELKKMSKQERKNRLDELLDDLHITHVRKAMAFTLSGGERRRVEIARALVSDPKFILLDEPFAGIDPIAVEDIQRIIGSLISRNMGVLITDHNVRETLAICNRAYIIYDGVILKSGSTSELAADKEVREKYLGEKFQL
ncbi:MAG: LPS export ABC transporter ATP-binding protein [candidate division Zixibacteria bacterium]|nr:LPS export ABC transporter ATP-binding protein [candidate division Zixibacteria bacterium]